MSRPALITIDGLPRTGSFELEVRNKTGSTDRAASWSATPDGAVTVTGASSFQPAQVSSVSVSSESGTVIVSLQR